MKSKTVIALMILLAVPLSYAVTANFKDINQLIYK